MTSRTIVCSECGEDVPYGRLSCPSCGELLASVAGGSAQPGRDRGPGTLRSSPRSIPLLGDDAPSTMAPSSRVAVRPAPTHPPRQRPPPAVAPPDRRLYATGIERRRRRPRRVAATATAGPDRGRLGQHRPRRRPPRPSPRPSPRTRTSPPGPRRWEVDGLRRRDRPRRLAIGGGHGRVGFLLAVVIAGGHREHRARQLLRPLGARRAGAHPRAGRRGRHRRAGHRPEPDPAWLRLWRRRAACSGCSLLGLVWPYIVGPLGASIGSLMDLVGSIVLIVAGGSSPSWRSRHVTEGPGV